MTARAPWSATVLKASPVMVGMALASSIIEGDCHMFVMFMMIIRPAVHPAK